METKPFSCSDCQKRFGSGRDVDVHWNAQHRAPNQLGRCEHCGLDRDLALAMLGEQHGENKDLATVLLRSCKPFDHAAMGVA